MERILILRDETSGLVPKMTYDSKMGHLWTLKWTKINDQRHTLKQGMY